MFDSDYCNFIFNGFYTTILNGEKVQMSMNFRDKAIFKISRNEVGDCTLELRRHILWVFPTGFPLIYMSYPFLRMP